MSPEYWPPKKPALEGKTLNLPSNKLIPASKSVVIMLATVILPTFNEPFASHSLSGACGITMALIAASLAAELCLSCNASACLGGINLFASKLSADKSKVIFFAFKSVSAALPNHFVPSMKAVISVSDALFFDAVKFASNLA